jgi:hypothetical protein
VTGRNGGWEERRVGGKEGGKKGGGKAGRQGGKEGSLFNKLVLTLESNLRATVLMDQFQRRCANGAGEHTGRSRLSPVLIGESYASYSAL